ncbi:MAG: glucokinase [Ktedonobacterales bacterium]|nr:glucokinase [Ktedonobacterales bacterium]
MLLAGDIGGTKTTLAIYAPEQGLRAPLAMSTYPSAHYPSLEALARVFLASAVALSVDRACFGVAGPVVEGRATITNLPWVMSEEQLGQALDLRAVRLLNDLEAIAHAVPSLLPSDLRTLNVGQPAPEGARAVIAPGTGLGEAYMTRSRAGYVVHPSEGGHADFAPTTAREIGLLSYLLERHEHVSYELVCSGRGLPNLYAYLKERGAAPESAWLAAQLAAATDPTPVIVGAALDAASPDPLAVATLRAFLAILGAEAGNLALKVLATGGVYLGGGMPPRILPFFDDDTFLRAFTQKGRFAELLARVPVHIILHPTAALLGAASYGIGVLGLA